jgi:hypothetical protein
MKGRDVIPGKGGVIGALIFEIGSSTRRKRGGKSSPTHSRTAKYGTGMYRYGMIDLSVLPASSRVLVFWRCRLLVLKKLNKVLRDVEGTINEVS